MQEKYIVFFLRIATTEPPRRDGRLLSYPLASPKLVLLRFFQDGYGLKRAISLFSLDLDLDSSRIQLDTLGHTPTPPVSVKSCHLCFLPGEPHLL